MMKMLKNVFYYMDVTITFIRMALLEIVEYPANILGWLLSNPIQFLLGFATIQFVVSEFGTIHGWNYGQLAFLYGISVLSHALSMIFFVNGWFMGWWVIGGEFDRLLTRPMSVVYQFFFTNINVMGVTDLIPGVIVFVYGCSKTAFQWSFGNLIIVLILLVGATLIRGGIYILLGCTTFWTKSTTDFGPFTQEMFDKTTMYPISMYPEGFQFVLTYLIPIGWVSFYPASGLLGIENGIADASLSVWYTLFIGIVVICVAACVFRIGLRQYESAGN